MKFKNNKFSLGVLFLFTLLAFTVACSDDDDKKMQPEPMEQTIVDIAVGNADFSILVDALSKAGLVDALNGTGSFTVFAPTNAAFQNLFTALGVTGIEDLSAEVLTPILLYHVIGSEVKSTQLSNGYVETLSAFTPGDHAIKLLVDLESGVQINGMSNVTSADIMASNGVIHIIDEVLLPPTVVDIAIANPSFTHLVAAVVKADLVNALMADGPFTVFAPTDAAFEALFTELGVTGIEDLSAETLTPILLYHVVSGNVRAADVSTGMVPTLNTEAELDINADGSGVMINGSTNVIVTDVQGKNGVVHVIDKVLLPNAEEEPQSIADIAGANEDFTSLVAALSKADLVETLDSEGTFTVFAPTNAAFEALFTDLGITSIDEVSAEALTQILLYHVLTTKKMSTDLTTGYLETLSTDSPDADPVVLRADVDGGVMLNKETSVTTADIEAFNGVIHIIDKVLLPPNVVDIAIADSTFEHLVAAVVKADLAGTLSGDGPFTIFAPTDAAFEALFTELGVSGIDDLSAETLTPILLYHVVSGNVRAAAVTTGMVPTLNDSNSLDIDTSSGVVINEDTNVIATDVQGTNGVIHAIDKVLLPE
ncbi:fasciclin domain-containing protein [Labilibaculum sp. DW002]|uniref:Fasciclin domain-containing protein n=1 Tax=Paralabilibaculum antarcticum TaxID=2912572 RepID=A0ABT5VMJ2_9BACT|nr:fasciclin domain-containing protein [Labilibaculum sp. DW002]MDE5416651.1 fasciclin domain-containing protein [Labilibaculum sp. DW002]